ncbi:MAG: hypothetical protein HKM93_08615 [Desulfobacteraceae bacterium]|nr:hypothetical protein [Desulfobacteraceae bacterium]
MNFTEFLSCTKTNSPPDGLSEILMSLWWDKKGDWTRAHAIAQEIYTKQGSAVHAYLHRREGVMWNADYWYSQAGLQRPDISLDEEWERLVQATLG